MTKGTSNQGKPAARNDRYARGREVNPPEGVPKHIQTEMLKWMDNFKVYLLANRIINTGTYALRIKNEYSALGTLITTVLLCGLSFSVSVLLSLVFSGSYPTVKSSMMASGLFALSFGIIKLLHDGIFPRDFLIFPRNLRNFILDENGFLEITDWFRSFLSESKQILCSSVFGLLGIGTLLFFERVNNHDFKVGSYFLVFLSMFAVGHGAYCAVGIPKLVKVISKQNMKMFWLNPADTSWVREASWIFTKLSMADALVAGIGITGLYLLDPSRSPQTAALALSWLFIGLAAVIHSFVYPHYYLMQAIKAEKRHQMEEIQEIISNYKARLHDLNEDEFSRLAELIKMYEQLASARETAIDLRALSNFLPALAIPILSYFGKALIDYGMK